MILNVSLNLHAKPVLCILDQFLADNWLVCKFSVNQTKSIYGTILILLQTLYFPGTESTLLKEGSLKTTSNVSWRFTRKNLFPFLTNVDTTNHIALALANTLPASTQRDSDIELIKLGKYNLKYPGFLLC